MSDSLLYVDNPARRQQSWSIAAPIRIRRRPQEWLDALDVGARARGRRARALPDRGADRQGAPLGRAPALQGDHRLPEHDPRQRRGAQPGRAGARAPHPLASCAGTRSRWWCRPTARAPSSAATSRASRRRATLYDVGFNHFFQRPPTTPTAATCSTSRATARRASTRARSSKGRLERGAARPLPPARSAERGLSSYPHPWLMPDFWQFPTVSMGLGPIMAIYQARFMRYLQHRGLIDAERRARSGRSSATARWTSPSRSARSRSRRARSSTT